MVQSNQEINPLLSDQQIKEAVMQQAQQSVNSLQEVKQTKVDAPVNLSELQHHVAMVLQPQHVKEPHRLSTVSLPPLPTFEQQSSDQRRMSTTSQPVSHMDYMQQQSLIQQDMSNQSSQQSIQDYESTVYIGQTQPLTVQHPNLQTIVEQNLYKEMVPDREISIITTDTKTEDQDLSTSEQVSEATSSTSDPITKKHKQSSKKFAVQKVHIDGTVECQLICKQKTISFKFNRFDTQPNDIIEGMVKENYLKPGSHRKLTLQLTDILRQLQENPDKLPETPRYVQKVSIKSIVC